MEHYRKQGMFTPYQGVRTSASVQGHVHYRKRDIRIKEVILRQDYRHRCEKRHLYGIGISMGFGLWFSQNFRSLDEDAGIPQWKWLRDTTRWTRKEKRSEA